MNLCTNAWHSIGPRSGTIVIALERVALQATKIQGEVITGEFACLSVTDDGAGMAPATLDRIFEPFFTTKPVGEGTGLGLAVVHGIVKSHGGSISVQSTLGIGTSFHIYFPAAHSLVQSPLQQPTRIIHGNRERILIVDDEPPLVLITQRALERIHYLTESFTRPEESIRAFRQNPNRFDLAIVDLNMPELDGLQLASRLLEIQPSLPILLVTGNAIEATLEDVHRIGIGAVLPKPHTLGELSHAVHQLLHRAPLN
jgi:CheY-like chemotaxis protein